MMTTAISRSRSLSLAGAKISTQRPHHLRQLWVVHPDLVRPAERAAGLDQQAITLLLLRRHLVIRNFGIAAKGWRLRHFGSPSWHGLAATHPATAPPAVSTRNAHPG